MLDYWAREFDDEAQRERRGIARNALARVLRHCTERRVSSSSWPDDVYVTDWCWLTSATPSSSSTSLTRSGASMTASAAAPMTSTSMSMTQLAAVMSNGVVCLLNTNNLAKVYLFEDDADARNNSSSSTSHARRRSRYDDDDDNNKSERSRRRGGAAQLPQQAAAIDCAIVTSPPVADVVGGGGGATTTTTTPLQQLLVVCTIRFAQVQLCVLPCTRLTESRWLRKLRPVSVLPLPRMTCSSGSSNSGSSDGNSSRHDGSTRWPSPRAPYSSDADVHAVCCTPRVLFSPSAQHILLLLCCHGNNDSSSSSSSGDKDMSSAAAHGWTHYAAVLTRNVHATAAAAAVSTATSASNGGGGSSSSSQAAPLPYVVHAGWCTLQQQPQSSSSSPFVVRDACVRYACWWGEQTWLCVWSDGTLQLRDATSPSVVRAQTRLLLQQQPPPPPQPTAPHTARVEHDSVNDDVSDGGGGCARAHCHLVHTAAAAVVGTTSTTTTAVTTGTAAASLLHGMLVVVLEGNVLATFLLRVCSDKDATTATPQGALRLHAEPTTQTYCTETVRVRDVALLQSMCTWVVCAVLQSDAVLLLDAHTMEVLTHCTLPPQRSPPPRPQRHAYGDSAGYGSVGGSYATCVSGGSAHVAAAASASMNNSNNNSAVHHDDTHASDDDIVSDDGDGAVVLPRDVQLHVLTKPLIIGVTQHNNVALLKL